MKTNNTSIKLLSLLLALIFSLGSCTDSEEEVSAVSSVEINDVNISKIDFESSLRGKNIIENFYDKLLKKNTKLQLLEDEIGHISNNTNEALSLSDDLLVS